MSRQEPIRAPVQQRSQKRVAEILGVARSIIEQKGAAGLTMSEIAQDAQISIGSIYQYFPNKAAIIVALAAEILEENTRKNNEILSETPRSLVHLSHITVKLLDQFYELQMQDPVARDVLAGFAADKSNADMGFSDAVRNRDQIFEVSRHLFRDDKHEQAKIALLILLEFGSASVALATQVDEDQRQLLMDETKRMLFSGWETSILPLAAAPKSIF